MFGFHIGRQPVPGIRTPQCLILHALANCSTTGKFNLSDIPKKGSIGDDGFEDKITWTKIVPIIRCVEYLATVAPRAAAFVMALGDSRFLIST